MARYRLMARSSSPSDRMLDRERVLQASHPEPGALDIDCVAPHLDGLAHAQAVAVDRQQERVVADAVASLLGCLEQAADLRLSQKVLVAFVAIGRGHVTLYISPLGRAGSVARLYGALFTANRKEYPRASVRPHHLQHVDDVGRHALLRGAFAPPGA